MASGSDNNLVTSGITGDGDSRAELAGLAVDLETVVEEVLKGGRVEDAVGGGGAAVDGQLGGEGLLGGDGLLLERGKNMIRAQLAGWIGGYLGEDGHCQIFYDTPGHKV